MGLFDIFRRKRHQDEQEEVKPTQTPTKDSATEESAGVDQAQDATPTENPQDVSAQSVDSAKAEHLKSESAVENHVDRSTDEGDTVVENEESSTTTESLVDETSSSQEDGESITESTEEEASSTEPVNSASADKTSEEKYDAGLEKSRNGFGARLNKFLANFRHVDEDFFEDLEDLMIESDVGYDMAMKLSDSLREEVKLQNAKSKQDVSNVIIQKMVELYDAAGQDEQTGINFAQSGPTVIMFVGVNGAGKTTTIGKMAARFKNEGKKVL